MTAWRNSRLQQGIRSSRRGASGTIEYAAFIVVLVCLSISMLGVPAIRYAVYASPVLLLPLWLANGAKLPTSLQLRTVSPFAWLLILFVFYAPISGWFAAKWTFFIAVYTAIFLLIDFSKTSLSLVYLNLIIVAIFVFSKLLGSDLAAGFGALEGVLLSSDFTTESTFAFPLGLFACFWVIQKRFSLAALNTLLALLAFKRIVVAAMLVFLVVMCLPEKFTRSRFFVVCGLVAVGVAMVLSIGLAQGHFDELVSDLTGQSAGAWSMGRRDYWARVLRSVQFDYLGFLFIGVSVERVLGGHEGIVVSDWSPFHNDLLAILLGYGVVAMMVFVSLILLRKEPALRALATFMLVLFLSDNVIIYQHVMIPYLLMHTALSSKES